MLIRRNSFQEKYDKLLSELRDEILNGRIRPGEFILPENSLSEKYKMSRVSVRKILAELVEEQLIEKIPGKGNRVTVPDNSQREVLSLAWFSNSYELEIVKKIILQYEETHPHVKVELTILPEAEYVPTLRQLTDQGKGPDVFILSDLHIRQLLELNLLDMLDSYVPPHLNEETSYPNVINMFRVDGRLVAAPFVFSPVVICYNEELLKQAGYDRSLTVESWDDLVKIAASCTSKPDGEGIIEQYGFCFSASANRWPVFVIQNGGTFVRSDDKRILMSEEPTVEALQFCVDLMYKHKVSPIYSHGSNYLAEKLFKEKRVAMILTTYYFLNEFGEREFEWDVMPVPGQRKNGTLLLGGGLGINKQSKLTAVARNLIDYMTGEGPQKMLKQHGSTIPVLRSVAEDNSLLNKRIHPGHYNAFLQVLPHALTLRDLHLRQSDIETIQNELHVLWANMEQPNEACKRIEQLL